MEFESASHAHEMLSKGYFLESAINGDPIPILSPCHCDGVVAAIYSRKEQAEDSASRLGTGYNQKIKSRRISGLWDTLVGMARHGIAGVMLDESHPVFFKNRLRDMNRSLPSLACLELRRHDTDKLSISTEDSLFFGVRGKVRVNTHELFPWKNYRAMDAMSVRWMLGDKALPESIDPHTFLHRHKNLFVSHNGATLLGPYVSDIGAVPIFSSRVWGEYYGLSNGLLVYQGETLVPTGDLVLQQLKGDFPEFLERIYREYLVYADIGLNPTCHRFRQGYFFKHSDDWYLRTLSGIFLLADGGFTPSPDVEPPKGDEVGGRHNDVDLVARLTTFTKYPFRRVLGANASSVPAEEAKEIVGEEFSKPKEPGEYVPPELTQINGDFFVIDGFDKINGQVLSDLVNWDSEWDGPLLFPDFIMASHWLLVSFLEFDEGIRIHGTQTCHGASHPGSNDPEREKAVSNALRDAIIALSVDALTNGYRPEHSLHLQRLFQDVSAVLELTLVGYLGDLAFYQEDELDYGDEEDERFRKKVATIRSRLANRVHLDDASLKSLRRFLGASLDELKEDSKQILAAAIDEFEQIGQRPGYDYAGVNLKLCKVAERELKYRVFDAWRNKVRSEVGIKGIKAMRDTATKNNTDRDRNGSTAIDFLEKRRKLELGAMRHILSTAGVGSKHPAIVSLSGYLNSLGNPRWLLSHECTDALDLIASKYRNGGVHEHLMSHEICVEAMNYVLQGEDAFLPKLLQATITTSESIQ